MKNIKPNLKTKRFQKPFKMAFLIVLFMLVALTKTNAITRYVNAGGTWGSNNPCHSTISAAITASSNGDVIIVNAGTYLENLTINKEVTLLGPNAAVSPNGGIRVAEAIIDLSSGRQINIGANNFSIKGFKIINSSMIGILSGGAMGTTFSKFITIEKNLFENFNGIAIYTSGSIADWTVTDNKINNVNGSAIVFAVSCINLTVTYNSLSNISSDGIQLASAYPASNYNIQNNTFTNITKSGINILKNINNFQIKNNTITNANTSTSGSEGGIKIQGLVNTTTAGVISNNTVSGSYNGIYVHNDFSLLNEAYALQVKVLDNIKSEKDIENLYNKPSEHKRQDDEFQVKQFFEIAMGKRKNYIYSYPMLYAMKMGMDFMDSDMVIKSMDSNMSFLIDAIEIYIKKKIF
jgi:hypothetical protein